MNQIHIDRFGYTPYGTFGVLRYHEFECYTVERPWMNNQPNVSCIPIGIYDVEPRRYNRGGYDTYEVVNVPNRSLILIHKGNTMNDVQGCIALGRGLGYVDSKWAVTSSRLAFDDFIALADELEPSRIVITNLSGGN